MKIDPYKHKERYLNWKESVKQGIPSISKENSEIILQYLKDMEIGVNISSVSVKGSRGYNRLNTLKDKLIFFSKKFNTSFNLGCIMEIKEEQLFQFFSEMDKGIIKRQDGNNFMGVHTYVKIFKAFWHWYQKIARKQGIEVKDITLDLDTKANKPKWVYLTEKQVKQLYDRAGSRYKVLIMFLFDTGIRAPTELINIRVSDLFNNCTELQIRDEISKTFGRRIKLMLCSNILKDYIQENNLKPEDQLFAINPTVVNRYLKNLAVKIFGKGMSDAGELYSRLSMYDFRHCSCCYWLPRYKSESALKYRFGWKKSDKIHYYSELLGMKDKISEEDLLIDITKTEIEKRLTKAEREVEFLTEDNQHMKNQMKEILKLISNAREIVAN
ncbi:MAG: tyrosine-type recombinase/integrase [Nanoarchaeota archaeon]